MSLTQNLEQRLADYYQTAAPPRAPDWLVTRVLDAIDATPQRRSVLGRPWGVPTMTSFAKVAVGVVAIVIVAAVGLTFVRQPSVGPAADLGIFAPVSGRILSGLWAVDPEATAPSAPSVPATQLRTGPEKVLALGWSSDGTELLFVREDPADDTFPYDRHLFILHADGAETQVTTEPVGGAAISPDGSRVAFAAANDDGLYVVDADGGRPDRIANGEEPTFSPDGTQIAYLGLPRSDCCVPGGREHVWVVNADGTDPHEILADEPALDEGAQGITWSPAGDRIAMVGREGEQNAIYTFAPDGSEFTKVITDGINPFWSPDGSQIAYLRPYDGPAPGLAIADADGANVREFGFGASGPWHPGPSSPSAEPSATPTSLPPTSPTAGSMWPQANLEEVHEAQARADAGDPSIAWQIDPQIANLTDPNIEIVTRLLREELGWEASLQAQGGDGEYANFVYVRCAPGGTNPMYPDDAHAGRCAPTIDELRYETVRLDLVQPIRSDGTGIWVVSRWAMAAPFAQSDPGVVQARATARLRAFLDARIAGEGAEGYVDLGGMRHFGTPDEVPLLYGSSTGAPYDRYEIDPVGGPRWPFGDREFVVRLFTDGDESVVEQPFRWSDSSLFHDVTQTRENGQPVALPFAFFDGQVILTAAHPWEAGFERDSLDLSGRAQEAIVLVVDPLTAAAGCEHGTAASDADALARSLQSDPDLQITAPVAVTVGGLDGLQMDVVLAPDASDCEGGSVIRLADGSDRRGANVAPGSRMRLYLLDLPEGSSMRVLAIAVVAPEARFETVMDAATPVLDSIAVPVSSGQLQGGRT